MKSLFESKVAAEIDALLKASATTREPNNQEKRISIQHHHHRETNRRASDAMMMEEAMRRLSAQSTDNRASIYGALEIPHDELLKLDINDGVEP